MWSNAHSATWRPWKILFLKKETTSESAPWQFTDYLNRFELLFLIIYDVFWVNVRVSLPDPLARIKVFSKTMGILNLTCFFTFHLVPLVPWLGSVTKTTRSFLTAAAPGSSPCPGPCAVCHPSVSHPVSCYLSEAELSIKPYKAPPKIKRLKINTHCVCDVTHFVEV